MHCLNKMDLTCTVLIRYPNRTADEKTSYTLVCVMQSCFCEEEESVYFLNDCMYTNEFEKIHMKMCINKHVNDTYHIRYEH